MPKQKKVVPLSVTALQIARAHDVLNEAKLVVTPATFQAAVDLEKGPVEVGPLIAGEVMTKDQTMRALRRLRKEGVSFSEIARQCGYRPESLLNAFLIDRIGPKMRQRMTWILRGLIKGDLVVVKRGNAQIFMPAGKALGKAEIRQHIERCICGRYKVCPCGAVKPARVQLPCLSSPIDAQDRNVTVNSSTPARQPSQNARDAAPLGASGFRPLSGYGRWPGR